MKNSLPFWKIVVILFLYFLISVSVDFGFFYNDPNSLLLTAIVGEIVGFFTIMLTLLLYFLKVLTIKVKKEAGASEDIKLSLIINNQTPTRFRLLEISVSGYVPGSSNEEDEKNDPPGEILVLPGNSLELIYVFIRQNRIAPKRTRFRNKLFLEIDYELVETATIKKIIRYV